jgi:2-C-methyl-D-erythritol 4-phosphate cytidylyltransferase / 2-C-methyl-D-erythritol 2,4-cyclodiphosphate synthase
MGRSGKIASIIVAAGSGRRAGDGLPKQYRSLCGKPMVQHSVESFAAHNAIGSIIIVIGEGQEEMAREALQGLTVDAFVVGGATRRDSVKNGLQYYDQKPEYDRFLIHDAARPFLPGHVIDALINALDQHDGAVPALPVVDSLARSIDGAVLSASESRDGLWRIQTPQAFKRAAIMQAHQRWDAQSEATDDARMAMASGFDVALVAGDEQLSKYTFASDFAGETSHLPTMPMYRTGMGYDVHRLQSGEELWLCGIKIAHDKGLAGHSDADVALHALTDAILGAAALGDIGDHFPPSDPQWRGASSDQFLAHAATLARAQGYSVGNVDLTIICEAPKIGPHRLAMRERVAQIIEVSLDAVSIKATTTERLGYTGREEGIAAQAVATLFRFESSST